MTKVHRTSVVAVARGLENVHRVEVVGFNGTATLWRRSLTEALSTARFYARLLDAPRSSI